MENQEQPKQEQKVIRHVEVIDAEIGVKAREVGIHHYNAKLHESRVTILLQEVDMLHVERNQALQLAAEKAKQPQIIVPPSKEGA